MTNSFHERSYFEGRRAVWRSLLSEALSELDRLVELGVGDSDRAMDLARLMREREAVEDALRSLFRDLNLEWKDQRYLAFAVHATAVEVTRLRAGLREALDGWERGAKDRDEGGASARIAELRELAGREHFEPYEGAAPEPTGSGQIDPLSAAGIPPGHPEQRLHDLRVALERARRAGDQARTEQLEGLLKQLLGVA